jgi:hypothetical protein
MTISRGRGDEPAGRGRRLAAARRAAPPGLLAAACVIWSAVPLAAAGRVAAVVLAGAAGCAAASAVRLVIGAAPAGPGALLRPGERFGRALADLVRATPWAEGTVIATAVLEALHRSRPWHTALLGAALLAYLLAVHLAESRARPDVLRPQLPLIAAGLGLLVLAAAAAALPAETGGAANLMAVLAMLAAVAVAGLILPLSPPR